MNEAEIERMVFRLLGDGTSYQAMLTQAGAGTTAMAEDVAKSGAKIEGIAASIKTFAGAAVSALASFGAVSYLKSAFEGFEQKENNTIRMSVALRANGRDVAATTAAYRQFATDLEQVSTSSVGNTMTLLRSAESFGLTGTAAQEAARQAVALSSAVDGNTESSESYLRLTAALAQGNIQQAMHMARMVPQLRGIHDETEFVARAQQLMAVGMETAKELSGTTGNEIERLNRSIKAFKTSLGETVSEAIKPFVEMLRMAVDWSKSLSAETRLAIVTFLGIVAAVLAFGPALLAAKAVLAMVFSPIGLIIAGIAGISIVISKWVTSMGGVSAVWGKVKEKINDLWVWLKPSVDRTVGWFQSGWQMVQNAAAQAWDWTKSKAAAFLVWAQPKWDVFTGYLNLGWRAIKWAAGEVWEFTKSTFNAFVTWATPYWETFSAFVVKWWGKINDAAEVAWNWIKAKVNAFITWFEPVFAATMGVVSAGWVIIKDYAAFAWDKVSEIAVVAWDYMTSFISSQVQMILDVFGLIPENAGVNWETVKQYAVEGMIQVEFGLRNFGELANYVWTGAKLAAVSYYEELKDIFTRTGPVYIIWFVDTVIDLFGQLGSKASEVFRNLSSNIVNIMSNLPDLLSGQANFDDLWNPLVTSGQLALRQLPNLLPREMSAVERELRRDFEMQGNQLGESFNQFRDRRLAEINAFHFELPEDAVTMPADRLIPPMVRAGDVAGGAFANAAKKEVEKFDAALTGSAEAMFRIQQFRDRMDQTSRTPAGPVVASTTIGGSTTTNVLASAPGGGGGSALVGAPVWDSILAELKAHTPVLKGIQDNTEATAAVVVNFA